MKELIFHLEANWFSNYCQNWNMFSWWNHKTTKTYLYVHFLFLEQIKCSIFVWIFCNLVLIFFRHFKVYDVEDNVTIDLLGSFRVFAAPGLCISIANDKASLKQMKLKDGFCTNLLWKFLGGKGYYINLIAYRL